MSTTAPRRGRLDAERLSWAGFCGHLWTVWALALSNLAMGVGALAALALPRAAWPDWRRYRWLLVPLGLYALFLLAAIAASYEPRTSLPEARELASLLTVPLALVVLRDERRVRRVVDGLIVMGALVSIWGLAQLLDGYGHLHQRIRGPFSHTMTFAGVLLVIDLLVLARLARGGGGRWRPWLWAAAGLINLALVTSLTRSAWVALVPVAVALLLLRAPRYLATLVPVALLAALLAPVPVVERVRSLGDVRELSNYDRLCMLEAGLLMVTERPLLGIGPKLARVRYPIYGHPTSPRIRPPHLHNSALQIAAEKGLPALAAYLWLMGGAAVLAWRRFRAEGGWRGGRADLFVGALLAIVAFNLAGLFEDNWSDTEVRRVVLLLVALPHVLAGRAIDAGGAEP